MYTIKDQSIQGTVVGEEVSVSMSLVLVLAELRQASKPTPIDCGLDPLDVTWTFTPDVQYGWNWEAK